MTKINLNEELKKLYDMAIEKKNNKLAYKIYCFIKQNKTKLQRLEQPLIKNIYLMTSKEVAKLARYLNLPLT
jgi:SPX domain protein involved in polyphosphate accumulation